MPHDSTDCLETLDFERLTRLAIRGLPRHYAACQQWDDLAGIMTDYDFIAAKVGVYGVMESALPGDTSVRELYEDYRLAMASLPSSHTARNALKALDNALAVAVNALERDPRQLPSQLHCRLLNSKDSIIQHVLSDAAANTHYPWFKPILSSLSKPGEPLLRVLIGHEGGVSHVVITEDGTRAISASDDRTLRVWDIDTGNCVQVLEGHTEQIFDIALTTNGRVISASADYTIRVWDIKTGRCLQKFDTSSTGQRPYRIAVFPNGKYLISASQSIHVWEIDRGLHISTLFRGSYEDIYDIKISPDGNYIMAVDYYKNQINIFHLVSGVFVSTIQSKVSCFHSAVFGWDGIPAFKYEDNHTFCLLNALTGDTFGIFYTPEDLNDTNYVVFNPSNRNIVFVGGRYYYWIKVPDIINQKHIYYLAINPFNNLFLTSHSRGVLRVWDISTGICKGVLKGHVNTVNQIAFTSDGKRAITASGDFTIRIWNIEVDIETSDTSFPRIEKAVLSANGHYALFVYKEENTVIYLWDLEHGILLHVLKGHTSGIEDLFLTSDGTRAVSLDLQGAIRIWDIVDGICMYNACEWRYTYEVPYIALAPDDKHFLHTVGSQWSILDIDHCKIISTIIGQNPDHYPITCVAITRDNTKVVLGCKNGSIYIWNLISSEIKEFQGEVLESRWTSGPIQQIIFIDNGTKIIVVYGDATFRIWDMNKGICIRIFEKLFQRFDHVTLMPDGIHVVSGYGKKYLHVWDINTGDCLRELYHRDAPIYEYSFSPDDHFVVMTYYDELLCVWDIANDKQLAVLNAESHNKWFNTRIAGNIVVVWDEHYQMNIFHLENVPDCPARHPVVIDT